MGRPIRPSKWLASADVTTTTALPSNSVLLHQSFAAAAIQAVAPAGGTIVRTRGVLWIRADQQTAFEDPVGALGFMVVRDSARAIGITAVPTPVTDSPDDAFFVHQWWNASMGFNQVDATGVQIWLPMNRYVFDSKAQRKFTGDDAIVVTLENSNAADGARLQLSFRMLIKPGASA